VERLLGEDDLELMMQAGIDQLRGDAPEGRRTTDARKRRERAVGAAAGIAIAYRIKVCGSA
jgi:hypothetical protein